ncbi:MAG TPA: extracellular solute-binding protein [Gaiellaceae bacterium]|nr:extracellular solute-binding protein [Gaiellaceae bacterium]
MKARRLLVALVAALVGTAVSVSVGSATTNVHRAGGTVSVLYAGSLVDVMEQQIGPAFSKATGYGYQGFGAGSKAVAGQIKGKLRQGDVFISAAPSVNNTLYGAGNGNWVTWYAEFASSPLVIGYNPNSRFASAFKTKRWWNVLQSSGLLLGRTDPAIDPKGQLTVQFIRRVEAVKNLPGLEQRVIGSPENTSQIFPEETLLGRLQAGQLDAGFFYSIEAKAANLPTVAPPLGAHYSARYTITILNNAPNAAGALAFVKFLLGQQGAAILKQDGFQLIKGQLGLVKSAVPADVKTLTG